MIDTRNFRPVESFRVDSCAKHDEGGLTVFDTALAHSVDRWARESISRDGGRDGRVLTSLTVERFETLLRDLRNGGRPFDGGLHVPTTAAEFPMVVELAMRVSADLLQPVTEEVLASVCNGGDGRPGSTSQKDFRKQAFKLFARLTPWTKTAIESIPKTAYRNPG